MLHILQNGILLSVSFEGALDQLAHRMTESGPGNRGIETGGYARKALGGWPRQRLQQLAHPAARDIEVLEQIVQDRASQCGEYKVFVRHILANRFRGAF